jgi:hypothetical protein
MPSVTNRVWPFGCVCHAVRALGSKCTLVALIRERSEGFATGVIVTDPVKNSLGAGPVSLPLLVTCIADPPWSPGAPAMMPVANRSSSSVVARTARVPHDGGTGERRWSYLHSEHETPEVTGC